MKTFTEYVNSVNWDFYSHRPPIRNFTHDIYPYPARLNKNIPKTLLSYFKNQDIIVLDPCNGSGTSMLECLLSNKRGIGIDANPFANLISSVKCTPLKYWDLMKDLGLVKKSLRNQYFGSGIMKFMGVSEPEKLDLPIDEIRSGMPQDKQAESLTNAMIKNLITIGTVINLTDSSNHSKNVMKLAFAQMIPIILKNRIRDKKIIYNTFVQQAKDLFLKIGAMHTNTIKIEPRIDIRQGDARKLSNVSDESIDLVITSPPRLSVMDYHLHNKYEMQFLGMDFRAFGKKEIGTMSRYTINRWKLLVNFFGDMYQMLYEICRVLKKGSFATIITGNAIIESSTINVVNFLSNCADILGISSIHSVTRSVKNDHFSSKGKGSAKEEVLLFFRKERHPSKFRKIHLFETVRKELEKYNSQNISNKIRKAMRASRSCIKIML